MKTKVLKLTATRINVWLKLSEARNLMEFILKAGGANITPEADIVATKLASFLMARINKEETHE